MTLLDIKNIDVLYDDFQVIWDVSLNVNNSEMVALLGPNGSGKSTVLNTISNLVEHKKGEIFFDKKLISNIPTYQRTSIGISHVLERRRVFPYLTVMQNLLLGAWHSKAKDSLDKSLSISAILSIASLNWSELEGCSSAFKKIPNEDLPDPYGPIKDHDLEILELFRVLRIRRSVFIAVEVGTYALTASIELLSLSRLIDLENQLSTFINFSNFP